MTQTQIVLNHLLEHGEISKIDAKKYGIKSLPSVISDLKRQGVPITSKWAYGINCNFKKYHYRLYKIEKGYKKDETP